MAPAGLVGSTAPDGSTDGTTRSLIRGSSLLLSGRFISLAITLVSQILVVRYLSKSDFGAFAYGLGAASIGASLILMGLDKAAARFVPIFQERGEPRKAFGTIFFSVGAVTATGIVLVALIHVLRDAIGGSIVSDPRALSLLLILIVLAPIDALDNLLQGQLAIFVGPRGIFVRRHLLGPGMKLLAILLVIAVSGRVELLAWGYIFGGLMGLGFYVSALSSAWRGQAAARPGWEDVPARQILGYSIPLLSSEVVLILRGSFTVILLEYLQTTEAVAEYRAVLPFAKLNFLVLESFAFLFIPLASRIFARSDRTGMNALYWQTTVWIAVLSFPVFAVMFALADPLTVLLFGREYASAAPVLSLLALGYYFHAALGFNHHILRVCGRVRYVVAIDLMTVALGLGLHLLLIPRYGALGAAIGTTSTFMLHKLLGQWALAAADTGVVPVELRYVRVYVLIVVLAAVLYGIQSYVGPPLVVSLVLAGGLWLVLLSATRHLMSIEETLPELMRIPLMRRFLG